jgi:hypothetical protein
LIAFNANLLKAGLNLTFAGDVNTVGNNPVNFNGKNGSLRVGVQFDAPFTRRLERNDYRSALIFYQQQRRQLYQYQDGINLTLRSLLRQLAQLEVNMEIQRRAVVIAVRRVDKTREDLNKPPAPVQPGMPVEALGPTVGQNLIFALNDLTNAQNNLMSVVLNYYQTRMLLYLNLGILDLDDCGMWIDKPIEDAEWLSEDECPLPPGAPEDWLEEAGVEAGELGKNESDGGQTEEVVPRAELPALEPIDSPGASGKPGKPPKAQREQPPGEPAENRESGPGIAPPRIPAMHTGSERILPAGFQGELLAPVKIERERTGPMEIKLAPSFPENYPP